MLDQIPLREQEFDIGYTVRLKPSKPGQTIGYDDYVMKITEIKCTVRVNLTGGALEYIQGEWFYYGDVISPQSAVGEKIHKIEEGRLVLVSKP